MRPNRIVMASPALNDDLGLAQSVEDLAAEQLIAKAGVEALDVAVLPRTAPLDIGNFGADSGDPSLDSLGDELRSVVGPDVTGNAAQMNRSERTSMTSIALSLRATRIARHSWVNSSMTLSIRYRRPSWVRSSTKS